MKLVALNVNNDAIMRFSTEEEAGLWAKVPPQAVIKAHELDERLNGVRWITDEGDFPEVKVFGDDQPDTYRETIMSVTHGLALIAGADRDGMVFDSKLNLMVSGEEVFENYLRGVKVADIYEGLKAAINQKHSVMDEVDAQKKEVQRLLITQPPKDSAGKPCLYVTLEDAPGLVDQLRQDLGIEGEVAPREWQEGFICEEAGVRYFGVNELITPYTLEEWKEGRKA